MNRQRRYTVHRHSLSDLWYVFDHLGQVVESSGFLNEPEAWAFADLCELSFKRDCKSWARAECAS